MSYSHPVFKKKSEQISLNDYEFMLKKISGKIHVIATTADKYDLRENSKFCFNYCVKLQNEQFENCSLKCANKWKFLYEFVKDNQFHN